MTKTVDLMLCNGTVITMNPAGHVFTPGVVVIENDAILDVGNHDLEARYTARQTLDCTGQIVMPGLINAHTHLPMTLLRGLADDLRLDVWLHGYMMPVERQFVNPDFCYYGTLLACVELIRSGVTSFADMYYFESHVATAATEAGVRGVCGATILKFPSPDAASYDVALDNCQQFIAEWKGHPLIVPAIAPHAPYTCTPDILIQATQIARQYDVPLLIHLSETAAEVEESIAEYGASPIRRVHDLGIFEANVLAAHCAHVDRQDMRLLSRSRCGVAHNPTSNLKLASGIAPVGEMDELGVMLGIGTDGVASNNDLDMFEEMRLAALLPKGMSGDPTSIPARTAVSMATIDGARALFIDHLTGSLEAGKRADVIVLDTCGAHATPRYELNENNLYAHLVYAAKASDTRHVIINGQIVMNNRHITTIDEEAVLAQARGRAAKIGQFVVDREHNVLDKLITLGGIAQEETFEVQVKARIEEASRIDYLLRNGAAFEIAKHTVREQYDTYMLFAGPDAGRLRYREDHVKIDSDVENGVWDLELRIAPEYRLTLIGPAVEREYENSAILTRSRYDAPAIHSLRFYQEYFQPVRIKEISKRRQRYRIMYRELEFSINLDQLIQPAYPDTFLEIKSRTWSAKDAIHKAEVISELLGQFGVPSSSIVRGEYVSF
jgi:5-methylthioadenosine/S-adenosylhomocysteine deaminase